MNFTEFHSHERVMESQRQRNIQTQLQLNEAKLKKLKGKKRLLDSSDNGLNLKLSKIHQKQGHEKIMRPIEALTEKMTTQWLDHFLFGNSMAKSILIRRIYQSQSQN